MSEVILVIFNVFLKYFMYCHIEAIIYTNVAKNGFEDKSG